MFVVWSCVAVCVVLFCVVLRALFGCRVCLSVVVVVLRVFDMFRLWLCVLWCVFVCLCVLLCVFVCRWVSLCVFVCLSVPLCVVDCAFLCTLM